MCVCCWSRQCQREKQSSQRGPTGRAAEESVSSYWQNTIAKCHEDVWCGFPSTTAFQAKMLTESEESSLGYTPWYGQGQTGEAAAQSTALHQCWQLSTTLSTQRSNQASRDRLRVKSDFALCLSLRPHKGGCVSSQHPMTTELSMTHQGTQGWFPTNNPESTANPPLNYISHSNPAQTCRVFDSHRKKGNYLLQRQAKRYLRISTSPHRGA